MIEFKNVSFSYDKLSQLNNINLKIGKGEFILLCGESGCGKTTITRLINGLIPHYYSGNLLGQVRINGMLVEDMPLYQIGQMIGSVFQNPRSQFFNVDTTSELAFGCENMGMPEDKILENIRLISESFNIKNLLNKSIFKLSGGEKQKIACASTAVFDPDVYVLDEPSSNLDAKGIMELGNMLKQWKEKGKTIIIAEHRLYFLNNLVDRAIYMKNGEIVEEFSSKDLNKMDTKKLGLRPFNISEAVSNDKIDLASDSNLKEYLSLKDFKMSYAKDDSALDIEKLDIARGSINAIVGHNGAGKSTFAKCICGLEKKSQGIISYGGETLKKSNLIKKCFMVMQDVNNQLFTESVFDEILLSMDIEDEEKANTILESLDLISYENYHPMSLSGGQKQRVAIASAIASEKEIMVFDEPTSGLDLKHMKSVGEILKMLKNRGKTIFVITHDIELILECCTDILHLDKGCVKDYYRINSQGRQKILEFFNLICK